MWNGGHAKFSLRSDSRHGGCARSMLHIVMAAVAQSCVAKLREDERGQQGMSLLGPHILCYSVAMRVTYKVASGLLAGWLCVPYVPQASILSKKPLIASPSRLHESRISYLFVLC